MKRHSIPVALLIATFVLPLGASAADKAAPATSDKAERQCSMPTSPRLQKKGDDCAQAKEWSRSYSNGEIRSTGQTDAREALRRLDPRLY